MNFVAALSALAPARERAVIINCGTKWATSLALVSALAHARCPVLVVDCESRDGSREHFARLARERCLAFDWLEWPLRPHPAALDALFAEARDERLLLVDSDVEVASARVVAAMRDALDADAGAYGAGFVHGPAWMGKEHGVAPMTAYYAERMWIPCVMLRVAIVREALAQGASFANRRVHTSRASGLRSLAYRLRHPRIEGPARHAFRVAPIPQAAGERGARFIEFDTGADLHRILVDDGFRFAAIDDALWGDVPHFHGVTRAALGPWRWRMAAKLGLVPPRNETGQRDVHAEIRRRLAGRYGVGNV